MSDPLSIAAGSFAIIGVVDVVLRASVECYQFLSEIKDAPAEIDRLRTRIKENQQLIDALKRHLDDLRDPTSSIPLCTIDSSSAVDGLNSTIRALHRELKALQVLAKRHRGDKTWARVKWLLDKRKISKSLETLERSKSTLNVALSLVEGRRSTLNQKRVEAIVQQNFQELTSVMGTQQQELSIVRSSQEKLLARQEEAIFHSTQQLNKTGLIQKNPLKAGSTNQIEHSRTRREIAEGNQKILASISEFSSLRTTTPKARMSNREIQFIGQHKESLLEPLLLMKRLVQQGVLNILSNDVDQTTSRHLNWLQSEFDNLVSSATQEAAALCPGSTATSFDQWTYATKAIVFPNTAALTSANASGNEYEIGGWYETVHQKRLQRDHEIFLSSSSVGTLRIIIPRASNATNVGSSIKETRLLFVPSVEICPTAISARFIKSITYGLEPRLYAQLNAFRLVENVKLHAELFSSGNLEDIDSAFRTGSISPYDQTTEGIILSCSAAVIFNRVDLFRYLDNQGVGLLTLNAEEETLTGFWLSIQKTEPEQPIEPFFRMLDYFNKTMEMCTSSFSTIRLMMPNWRWTRHVADEHVRLIRAWMQFLQRNGYDFNLPYKYNITPLHLQLVARGARSLAAVRSLIEFGADVHMTGYDNWNALHVAMRSNIAHDQHEFPEILEEKLSLLIEAGVNLHHIDNAGYTPSLYARFHTECYAVWCRALKRNGINISEVIRDEIALWHKYDSIEHETAAFLEAWLDEESEDDDGDDNGIFHHTG